LVFGIIILLIITPLLGLFLRNHPADKGLKAFGEKNDEAEMEKPGVEYQTAIKSPIFYALMVFAFLMIAVSTLNLFLPAYVISVGFSVEQSALTASAVMLGVTIGKIALGYINDKNDLAGVFTSTALGVVGFIFLILGEEAIFLIYLGAFLFGWAYAAVTVETALLVRTVFGSRDYSKIFSNISIALALGGALMAGAWGYLVDLIHFKLIFIIGITLLVISAFIGWYALKSKKTILISADTNL
jgi:MFS family permease